MELNLQTIITPIFSVLITLLFIPFIKYFLKKWNDSVELKLKTLEEITQKLCIIIENFRTKFEYLERQNMIQDNDIKDFSNELKDTTTVIITNLHNIKDELKEDLNEKIQFLQKEFVSHQFCDRQHKLD